ncbi:MAG: sigma-70 family RNA polymerase sigma factor [Aureliella sp.]
MNHDHSLYSQTQYTQRLVELAQGNDPAAFDALIHHVSSRLCAITHRMLATYPQVRRWEQTDDVLQELLLRLNRSLREVRPQSVAAFFGLAMTQLRRTLIDLSRHYNGVYGLGTKHESTAAEKLDGHADEGDLQFSKPILALDDWTAFHEAIDRLPAVERETFSLKWYAGLTQQQISELLDLSERTVIRRLISARTLLSGWLANHETFS